MKNLSNRTRPDFVYNSILVSRLINKFMVSGKKEIAQNIVYSALDFVVKYLKDEKNQIKLNGEYSIESFISDPSKIIEYIVFSTTPKMKIVSMRVGGANYQVPCQVEQSRALCMSIKWIVDAVKSRSERTSVDRFKFEIIDILNGKGAAVKKMSDMHKMAESNRAFAHFANFNNKKK